MRTMKMTSVMAAGVLAAGVLTAGVTARGQEDAPPAPRAVLVKPVAPAAPAGGDVDGRADDAVKRTVEQARRQVEDARRLADQVRRSTEEARAQWDAQNRQWQLLYNAKMPMEYRGPTAWWGTVNDLSRMSNDPTSMAVAAVVQASDLLKPRGAGAEVKYFEELLPQVSNPAVQRAVRLQLIDAYKRANESDKALGELEKLITAAPATAAHAGHRARPDGD